VIAETTRAFNQQSEINNQQRFDNQRSSNQQFDQSSSFE
jgi:hypothetical protein